MENFVLKYSHNIIEHLGLKLYQNKPTNVIAELVSNSWDADATNVFVDIDNKNSSLSVIDDGHGMDSDTLRNHYLIIGKKKRADNTIKDTSPGGRYLMGRKGIGKLAPFGVANKISIVTCYCGVVNWLEMNIGSILSAPQDEVESPLKLYKPDVLLNDASISDFSKKVDALGEPGQKLLKVLKEKKQGTLILMSELSLRRAISESQVLESLGRRFTVTLMRKDFSVSVNEKNLDKSLALPDFEYFIPSDGGEYKKEIINIAGKDRTVGYWVGFVKSADWPQDEAGVGVYSHGKIAQDRPFFFGLKGNEIYTRYMYAVVEVDWADELDEDVISTDRTSVNWSNEEMAELYEWGHQTTRSWIAKYKRYLRERSSEEIKNVVDHSDEASKFTDVERKAITEVVQKIGPKAFKDKEFQGKVVSAVSTAWSHKPMRDLVRKMWDSLETVADDEDSLFRAVEQLNEHLVPESLSLSAAVSQKIYALSKLNDLKTLGKETQLQVLLEEFPWILSSDMEKLSANVGMRKLVENAQSKGLLPVHHSLMEDFKKKGSLRPDFVFLSDEAQRKILVVEIKSPQTDLTIEHRSQLVVYLDFLKQHFHHSDVYGYLIGRVPAAGYDCPDTRITVKTWDQVFAEARRDYLELLAAMLGHSTLYADDSRVKEVISLGGPYAFELLQKMARKDSALSDTMERINKKLDSKE